MSPIVANILTTVILLAIAGAVIFYIYRHKKKGGGCIGCPYSNQCASKGNCSCGKSKNGENNKNK